MVSQIEDGDLAHLACDAIAAHQAKREVALTGGFVVGTGLTNEHVCHANGETDQNQKNINCYGTTKHILVT